MANALAYNNEKVLFYETWGGIDNTLFSSQLTNGTNKLECLSLGGFTSTSLKFVSGSGCVCGCGCVGVWMGVGVVGVNKMQALVYYLLRLLEFYFTYENIVSCSF